MVIGKTTTFRRSGKFPFTRLALKAEVESANEVVCFGNTDGKIWSTEVVDIIITPLIKVKV